MSTAASARREDSDTVAATEAVAAGAPATGAVTSGASAGDGRARDGVITRFNFGARPTIGAAAAIKAVAQDTSELVKAELDLAKAELAQGAKANAMGIGMLVGAGVLGWLILQGLLIAAGLALALVMPGWAAALVVCAVLLVIAVILALIGRKMLGTPVSVDQAKTNVQEDVAWFKTHLRRR